MKVIKIKSKEIKRGIPKIAVSLMGKNKEEIFKNMQLFMDENIDIVEWRIDDLEEVSADTVISVGKQLKETMVDKILLFTFRTKEEGGNTSISLEGYKHILTVIIDNDLCDMIDIEMFKDEEVCGYLCAKAQKQNIYVVGSTHNFSFTENKDEIKNVYKKLLVKNVDICKVARMPKTKEDVTNLMYAAKEVSKQYPTSLLVGISMGELGKISRIEGELFDSVCTFACLQQSSAPGQIEVKEMRKFLLEVHKKTTPCKL